MRTMADMTLGEKLSKLIATRGTNKANVARTLGVSKSTIANWIEGKGVPKLYEAAKLADALGVPLDYLADDTLDEPPGPELAPDEAEVFRLVRRMGVEEAHRRLLQLSDGSRRVIDDMPPEPAGHRGRA